MYHRQPTGFGPMPGPRFDVTHGNRFSDESWQAVKVHIAKTTFRTDHSSLQRCLPDGYELDETTEPTVTFEIMNLENLPWLAGRGYNTLGVYISGVKHVDRTASLLAVLFENRCDPIVTGREELGFPKVFADIEVSENKYSLSWEGHEFMTLQFDNLQEKDGVDLLASKSWSTVLRDGFFVHRYVPSVGQPGVADAEYPVFVPPAQKAPPVVSYQECSRAHLEVKQSTFEQLPTLYTIVNALAALPVHEVRESCIVNLRGASDCRHARKM